MDEARDHFARSSARRAHEAAKEANGRLEDVVSRLAAIENRIRRVRRLGHCCYCGELCVGSVCRAHVDLLFVDDMPEESL